MMQQDCQGCPSFEPPCRKTDNGTCLNTGDDIGNLDKCPELETPFTALVNQAERDYFPWLTERIEIETDEQKANANDLLGIGKRLIRELEKARRDEKKPFEEQAAAVDARYNPVKNKIQLGVDRLSAAIIAYANKIQSLARERQRQQEAELLEKLKARKAAEDEAKETGELLEKFQPPQITDLPSNKVKGNMSSSSISTTYEYIITDENSVPRELCTPDLKKIRAYAANMRTLGQTVIIPGVLINEKQGLSTRLG